MKDGISDMAIYIPPLYLAHDDLADARSVPREKFTVGLGNNNMAIVPPWEDSVTMAANAAEMVIENAGIAKDEIGLIVVSTETGVDHAKPVASFVQGLLGIGPRVRVYEIKHACYGGTAAIMNAVDWIKSKHNRGKKALVITVDIANYGLNSLGEPTQGAGAVAFILSDQAELIHFSPHLNASYSEDVYDFWRPNDCKTPIVDGHYSIECYLKVLEFCAKDLQNHVVQENDKSLLDFVDYFIYHLPFAKMASKAHYRLISTLYPDLSDDMLKDLYERSFEAKTKPTLLGSREVGNIYTGSVYMSLISLMEEKGKDLEGKIVAIFSYGSGCGAEYFLIQIGQGIKKQLKQLNFKRQLEKRRRITMQEYSDISQSNIAINPENITKNNNEFAKYFFVGVKDHKRIYIKNDDASSL